MNLLKKWAQDDAGTETVEWAVLAAPIVIGVIFLITQIGANVYAVLSVLKDGINP